MCDHTDSYLFTKNDPPVGDCDPDHCNIYYVHQHGLVYCHSNVQFIDHVGENTSEDVGGNVAESFCGDDRLTLIHLPSTPEANNDSKNNLVGSLKGPECLQDTLSANMPAFFQEKLKKICEHCECKQSVLWNNFRRDEQHFDACFRYVNKATTQQRKCFLKLYTLRVPFLSDLTVSFSMVHHIRAEGEDFDSASSADKTKGENNQEHMFAFIYGLDGKQMQTLLTNLVSRWQDITDDHLKPTAGITPRLFVAALISQYGSIISEKIQKVYKDLKDCDNDLRKAIHNLEMDREPDPSSDQTEQIRAINQNLIGMNIELTGTKSTMHYLAESAKVMVEYITPFENYVEARLNEWHTASEKARSKQEVTDLREPDLNLKKKRTKTFNQKLLAALQELDSCREKTRDHDKLVMVRKNMLQYKIDIESLRQHININVGMVSNVIAARDRSIQQSILANTARDGTKMKFMAILTAFFLPGTFMAVLLSTPMFNLLDDTKPLLTKRGIPLGIYWGGTLLGFFLLLIVLFLLRNPDIICKLIDVLIPLKIIKKGQFYKDCKKRGSKLKAEANRKKDIENRATIQKEKPADKTDVEPGQQSHKANSMNGKSTSTDMSSQGRSNSGTRWSRSGRGKVSGDGEV